MASTATRTYSTTFVTTLIGKEEVAEGTMAIHFERPPEFDFRAGQYVELTLRDPAETDWEGNTREMSLASAPSDRDLVIATRIRDTAFKRSLNALDPGSKVQIDGPMGGFTLTRNVWRPVVMIAGGIGITPFLSMLIDVTRRGLPQEIHLFYADGWPEHTAYLHQLERMQAGHRHVHFIPTMTEVERSHEEWRGETGRVDREMLERHLPSLPEAVYYIAGSSGMVTDTENLLRRAGAEDRDIHSEQFGGY